MPDLISPFGCPECRITSWTGEPTALFSEDFEVYAGSELAFQSVWSGAGHPLTQSRVYEGAWAAGDYFSAGLFSRGINPSTPNLIFSLQVYWTGSVPSGEGIIQFTTTAVHTGFNLQCGMQFLTGGEIQILRSSSGTPVDLSSVVLVRNQWNCVTGIFKITQDGAYRVYCNGALVLDGEAPMIHIEGDTAIGGIGFGMGAPGNYWVDNLWAATVESYNDAFFCTIPPTPPHTTPCACPGPPGQPPPITYPPPITPGIGEQLVCLGGGLVPIQADFAPTELWWGL